MQDDSNNDDDDDNGNGNKGNGKNDDDDDDDDVDGDSVKAKPTRSLGSQISHRAATSGGNLPRVVDASEVSALEADGADPETGLYLGRWYACFKVAGPVHWVADTSQSGEVVLPQEGRLEYSLSGGTAPTDNHGNTGSLESGSLTADFTNQTVSSNLSINIGGDSWQATGQGSIATGSPVFDGAYEVNRGSGATGTGNFTGFFGGNPLPSGAPSGAGLGYQLNSGDTSVSGAAAFSAKQ